MTTVWTLDPLYKLDLNGSMRLWKISHVMEDDIHYLSIEHGVDGGAIVSSRNRISENQSGRSIEDQVQLEARSRYKDKFREGYRPQGVMGSGSNETLEPMLANKWISNKDYDKIKSDYKAKRIPKDLTVGHKRGTYPAFCQPKLDGIRAMARYNSNNTVSLLSRGRNNEFSFLEHLKRDLSDFITYMPANAIIDGELYKHDWDFQYLTSVVKTTKNRKDANIDVEYHIFDYMDKEKSYEERFKILFEAYKIYASENPNTKLFLVFYTIVGNDEEVEACHQQYFEQGYEGVMVRDPKSFYTPGRSSNILKYKIFTDEEAEIIGVEDAKGTEEGKAMLKVKDLRGNEFPVRMRATFEERAKWLKEPSLVLGKMVTIRYQELSSYGVPRFPVGVAIRDYE